MKIDDQIKRILITGGAQGIGAGIACFFAKRGYEVIVVDVDEEAGNEIRAKVEETGARCRFYPCDIRDEEDVRSTMGRLQNWEYDLDVLVNNAGISKKTPLESSMDEWDHVINVNLRGAYLMTKYAVPLVKKGGSVINIASTRATMSEKDYHAYAASKGGIAALTHSLAVTLGPDIRVNAISPGWIDVTSWRKESNRRVATLTEKDHLQHPAGRVGRVEDIAAACWYLVSDEAGFVTGTNMVVDGGMTVKMIYED